MEGRLQKIISDSGFCSRREAEKLIEGGKVRVNGQLATLGQKADSETDNITINGNPLRKREERVYIMLNKPRGYVSTLSDEHGRKTVAELVQGCGTRVYPIGRLDLNSEGLLLMTNDGEFAQRMTHPSHEVQKVYLLSASGEDLESADTRLSGLREIEGERIKPAEVSRRGFTEGRVQLLVKLSEGKNRQIRRMCDSCGLKVHRLKRIEEAGLTLEGLAPGKWRMLNAEERKKLGIK